MTGVSTTKIKLLCYQQRKDNMPVYEFRCSECLEQEEVLVDMDDRNEARIHACGAVMERLISLPGLAIVKVYNPDKLKDTLNDEDRYAKKDGRPVRSKRSQDALYRGIDYRRPLEEKVFTGF